MTKKNSFYPLILQLKIFNLENEGFQIQTQFLLKRKDKTAAEIPCQQNRDNLYLFTVCLIQRGLRNGVYLMTTGVPKGFYVTTRLCVKLSLKLSLKLSHKLSVEPFVERSVKLSLRLFLKIPVKLSHEQS